VAAPETRLDAALVPRCRCSSTRPARGWVMLGMLHCAGRCNQAADDRNPPTVVPTKTRLSPGCDGKCS